MHSKGEVGEVLESDCPYGFLAIDTWQPFKLHSS